MRHSLGQSLPSIPVCNVRSLCPGSTREEVYQPICPLGSFSVQAILQVDRAKRALTRSFLLVILAEHGGHRELGPGRCAVLSKVL